ncbi:MAG: VOC family protein [Roseburia sp.]|nr:VOC family protein [Roseburia sp.]MCM1277658.1 VOC family protein [Robinsoniella sp.]
MFTVDHYAISVKNLKASIAFYQALEFEVVKSYEAEDGSMSIVHMKNGEFILELFAYKECKDMPEWALSLNSDLPVAGSKHFGLYVEDLEEAGKYLLEKQLISKMPEIKTGRLGRSYFFLSDPNGILVEIIQGAGR